jgi:hypothetical protein
LAELIEEIQQTFRESRYEYSLHAVDKSILLHIARKEVEEAIASGEMIEDYPQDKYGPSCLIYGVTEAGRHLHVQCSYPQRPKVKIITVYEPDSNEWINFKVRRQSNEV